MQSTLGRSPSSISYSKSMTTIVVKFCSRYRLLGTNQPEQGGMILMVDHAASEGCKDQFIERLCRPLWCRKSVWIPRGANLVFVHTLRLCDWLPQPMTFCLFACFELALVPGIVRVLSWHVTQKKYVVRFCRQHQTKTRILPFARFARSAMSSSIKCNVPFFSPLIGTETRQYSSDQAFSDAGGRSPLLPRCCGVEARPVDFQRLQWRGALI